MNLVYTATGTNEPTLTVPEGSAAPVPVEKK